MNDQKHSHEAALEILQFHLGLAAMNQDMRNMSEAERLNFQQNHPGAHFVIGDFEIKCLRPEKYNLI